MNNKILQFQLQLKGLVPKNIKNFALRIILLLSVFLGGYYFFVLSPKLVLSAAYLKTEEIFREHSLNLLQNRIAVVGLARLDVNSSNLNGEKIDLFATLQKTNKEGLRLLDERNEPIGFKGIPSEHSKFLNNDLKGAFPSLLAEERIVLEEQKGLISDLNGFDAATAILLNYQAEQDLGKLDLAGQKEEILTRANNAKEGIGKIPGKLDTLGVKSSEIQVLWDNIKKTQTILDDLVLHLKKGNARKAEISRAQAIKNFSILRKNALAAQSSFILSEASVKLLTRQTNLILEYDFWLKKIDSYQLKLVKK